MPYFPDLNSYLHQSSLLLQAYPTSTRITTKYSLPRQPNPHAKRPRKQENPGDNSTTTTTTTTTTATTVQAKKEPTATLTVKTFDPTSGICLKYRTDKAAEVGRLMSGLRRLARGELVEMPLPQQSSTVAADQETTAADKMDLDGPPAATAAAAAATGPQIQGSGSAQTTSSRPGSSAGGGGAGGGGGGKGKKKKGKR